MGIVRYIDYDIERLPNLNMFHHIMHKNAYLSFEREIRAVATPPATVELGLQEFCDSRFGRLDSPDVFVYAPPIELKELIRGVVLHPQATSTTIEEVTRLCSREGLPAPETSSQNRIPTF